MTSRLLASFVLVLALTGSSRAQAVDREARAKAAEATRAADSAWAEVRRLQAVIAELTARIEALEHERLRAPAVPAPATPARPAEPAPAPRAAASGRPLNTPENEAKYVDGRSRDLLAASTAGMASGSIGEEQLARWRTARREQAAREWRGLMRLYDVSDELGERGEPEVYTAAAHRISDMVRDPAGYGQEVSTENIRRWLESAADRVRLEARARR